jgi:hypothetical protein
MTHPTTIRSAIVGVTLIVIRFEEPLISDLTAAAMEGTPAEAPSVRSSPSRGGGPPRGLAKSPIIVT